MANSDIRPTILALDQTKAEVLGSSISLAKDGNPASALTITQALNPSSSIVYWRTGKDLTIEFTLINFRTSDTTAEIDIVLPDGFDDFDLRGVFVDVTIQIGGKYEKGLGFIDSDFTAIGISRYFAPAAVTDALTAQTTAPNFPTATNITIYGQFKAYSL